VASIDINVF